MMSETHTPWRVRGTFVESDERVICECSMAEDAERIVRDHNDISFHRKQASDAHTLLQTQGVEMRRLEQELAVAQAQAGKTYKQVDSETREELQAAGEQIQSLLGNELRIAELEKQLATARKLIEELTMECREHNTNDRNNHTPEGLLVDADQFLADTASVKPPERIQELERKLAAANTQLQSMLGNELRIAELEVKLATVRKLIEELRNVLHEYSGGVDSDLIRKTDQFLKETAK